MNGSLNEIAAMAKKAARGCSYSWGLAEDAAVAARFLTTNQLPGPTMLAAHLTWIDGKSHDLHAPRRIDDPVWSAGGCDLCPIITGATISDLASRLGHEAQITCSNLMHPLLLAGMCAGAAIRLENAIAFAWDGVVLETDGVSIMLDDPRDGLSAHRTERLTCRVSTNFIANRDPVIRGQVDAPSWNILSAFAARTYAPATERSRLLGAGAGTTDND